MFRPKRLQSAQIDLVLLAAPFGRIGRRRTGDELLLGVAQRKGKTLGAVISAEEETGLLQGLLRAMGQRSIAGAVLLADGMLLWGDASYTRALTTRQTMPPNVRIRRHSARNCRGSNQ